MSLKGLYPVGEGCGYAGGIVSAAVDGLRQRLADGEFDGGENTESSLRGGALRRNKTHAR